MGILGGHIQPYDFEARLSWLSPYPLGSGHKRKPAPQSRLRPGPFLGCQAIMGLEDPWAALS